MSLLDETGRRYQPTPLEGAPLPSGRLLPGGTLEGSVGYLIPTAAASGIFLWQFNPQPGRLAPAEVEFELPRPTPTPPPQARWRIQVDEARWLPEEGVLEIRGRVWEHGGPAGPAGGGSGGVAGGRRPSGAVAGGGPAVALDGGAGPNHGLAAALRPGAAWPAHFADRPGAL